MAALAGTVSKVPTKKPAALSIPAPTIPPLSSCLIVMQPDYVLHFVQRVFFLRTPTFKILEPIEYAASLIRYTYLVPSKGERYCGYSLLRKCRVMQHRLDYIVVWIAVEKSVGCGQVEYIYTYVEYIGRYFAHIVGA